MIEPKKIPQVKENVDFLKNQLVLFKKKIEAETKIIPNKNTIEEEKSRIADLIDEYIATLPKIIQQTDNVRSRDDLNKIGTIEQIGRLQEIDKTLFGIKTGIKTIVTEQFNCSLENYRRELNKAVEAVLELFIWLVPNIKHEINFLRKYYRIPSNASNTIIPQMEDLVLNLENHKITLNDFMNGYGKKKDKLEGYSELRQANGVFSKYQFFENSSEVYDALNKSIVDICKAIWPFVVEQKTEQEFAKLFSQIEDINRRGNDPKQRQNVSSMKDIFEFNNIFRNLVLKVGKKFSYREEYKNCKSKVDEYNKLQKEIVSYHNDAFGESEKELSELCSEKKEQDKFALIIDEVKKYMEEKTLPFDRIELVFEKLRQKDFNIIVQEKEADDLAIKITPHLAEKFGENNLKRVNIVIQEIDFWFPYETKQMMFGTLSSVTQKIQADEPLDKKEFVGMMEEYNKEINDKYRKIYPAHIALLNKILENFAKTFSLKREQERLCKKLMDKDVWKELSSRVTRVKRNMAVLSSNHESIAQNINKFPFLKNSLEDFCQLLYDFSMQLFILYEMADQRSIMNMTNILSTFNEYHDVKSLWQSFSHYFQQSIISNFYANETKMIRMTQNALCKQQLDKLFPKKKK